MTETPTRLGRHAQWLFADYLGKIEYCLGLLGDREVWQRGGLHCNSIGNLVLHLEGNLSQWVLAGLGGAAFERARSAEFAARRRRPRRAAQPPARDRDPLPGGGRRVARGELLERRVIQGYQRDGFGALLTRSSHELPHRADRPHRQELLGEASEIDFYPHLKGELIRHPPRGQGTGQEQGTGDSEEGEEGGQGYLAR
jgi:hypothetical protein